jgi:ABC-2 type transport system ATP-binding protein
MPALISINQLSRYYGDFCAVDQISFELNTGDILGFLGPNGAGKSTTMQMITGNLAPSEGEIMINGIDLLEHPKAAKQHLGYLPETPPLYRELTVLEYLRYCARLHAIDRAQIKHSCEHAMQRCGLEDVSRRLIANLSKGYQQRVGIAQAILHNPPVVILDEPTVGLDPIQIIEIRDLIRSLGDQHGVILCTHILPEVQAVCNRVQIINRGKLVYNSNTLSEQMAGVYQFRLKQAITVDDIIRHDIFTRAQAGNDCVYIVHSDRNAEDISRFIVDQGWGLLSFDSYQPSLEQTFINITSGEYNQP